MTEVLRAEPAISVVVPVYNGGSTIVQCVESLLATDYPQDRLEIICVDNASTDDTGERLLGFVPRIRVLREDVRGAAAARNCGIRAALYDIIAFTDADCVVDSGWLTGLAARVGEPGVGIVGGRIAAVAGANAVERFGERIHDHRRAIEEFRPPYAITMNWASPRRVLLEAGLFDESLLRGQDTDLAFRIGAAGWRMVYAPEAVVRHFNERSVWGLFWEGYTHGRYAPLVRLRLAPPRRRSSRASQMRKAIRRLFRPTGLTDPESPFVDRFYAWVFNAGKACGEIRTIAIGPPGR